MIGNLNISSPASTYVGSSNTWVLNLERQLKEKNDTHSFSGLSRCHYEYIQCLSGELRAHRTVEHLVGKTYAADEGIRRYVARCSVRDLQRLLPWPAGNDHR